MNRGLLCLFTAGMFASGSAQLRAQETMSGNHDIPKVLRIYKEEMKPGRGGQHEKVEAGYVRAMQKANWRPLHCDQLADRAQQGLVYRGAR